MEPEAYYLEIGRIANSSSRPIKLSELSEILGIDYNRGVHNRVRGAYNYFKSISDEHTAAQIRKSFIDENGNYAYMS